ncbi:MAG: septation protein SepH [Actinomycetota bacterium]|nr:septation protein SepH [Actinomycetota bacterium]
MVRLHLVGFTTDLKNLIFASERGATEGEFVLRIDSRLRKTLEEVARLAEETEPRVEEVPEPRRRRQTEEMRPSKLTPKEIQSLVRQGKSEEQVARLAQTDVAWIRRFTFPILAERAGVIDAVKSARLSKPRLGVSAMSIGRAVEENLGAKRLRMAPEELDASWKAVRKNGRWHVSFEYDAKGRKRLARFSFDPDTREVEALNDVAFELGWRSAPRPRPATARAAEVGAKPRAGIRSSGATRSAGASSPKGMTRGGGTTASAGRVLAERNEAVAPSVDEEEPAEAAARDSSPARPPVSLGAPAPGRTRGPRFVGQEGGGASSSRARETESTRGEASNAVVDPVSGRRLPKIRRPLR